MVQEIPRTRQQGPFPEAAPAAFPVFYRTYSRRGEVVPGQRETWDQVCERTLEGLKELGNLTDEEMALLNRMQRQVKALPSGRWLWVGGTAWSKQPENFSGAYNCTSTNVVDWRAFGLMMDLAMMGCGTGAILEPKYIDQIPAIRNRISVTMGGDIGTTPAADRREITEVSIDGNQVNIRVGDSRQGWVQSYQTLLELSTDERFTDTVEVTIDLSDVRPAGEKLKGFGGVANPIRLSLLYDRCANILNKALGRQLNSVECCLLIDEAAACVVAGNIRRSAGMRQFDSNDELAAGAKDNLWQQDAEGNWRIDPERDVLRMANHTRVFHEKPSLQDCVDSVRKQFYSGEGAIQWAGEAIARSNADLLNTAEKKEVFIQLYGESEEKARAYLKQLLLEERGAGNG
jgi:ribonucleotide reductase class II